MMDIQVKWEPADQLQRNLGLIRDVLGVVLSGKSASELDELFRGYIDHLAQQGTGYGFRLEREEDGFSDPATDSLLADNGVIFLIQLSCAFTVGALKILDLEELTPDNREKITILMCKSMFYTGQLFGVMHGTETQVAHRKALHAKGAEKTNSIFDPVRERFCRDFAAYKQANQWRRYSAAVREISMQAFKDGSPFLNPNNNELLSDNVLIKWAKEHDKTSDK